MLLLKLSGKWVEINEEASRCSYLDPNSQFVTFHSSASKKASGYGSFMELSKGYSPSLKNIVTLQIGVLIIDNNGVLIIDDTYSFYYR